MQDNRPDRPDVITLPPLILAATIALGVVLNFFWPASLLPSALAAPVGILITLGAIALGISAIREMFAANTPLDVRKPSTEIVTAGVFRKVITHAHLPRGFHGGVISIDGLKDGLERTCARAARGIDGAAHGGFIFGGPHGAIAIGDFALDDGGSQSPFASIVGRLDVPGKRTKDEQLVSCAGDFADQFAGDGAGCRRRQNIVDLTFQFASSCAKRRLRHAGKSVG